MITPTKAKEKAILDPSKLKKLEKIIDDAIIKGVASEDKCGFVDIDDFPNYLTMEYMMIKYRAVGWDVNRESIGRGDVYVTFREPFYRNEK